MPFLQNASQPSSLNLGDVSFAASSIDTLADGGFVITISGFDYGNFEAFVRAQRYDATGAPVGDLIVVRIYNSDNPSATVLGRAGGGFVVAWNADADGATPPGDNIFFRIYDANGVPLGPEVQANTTRATNEQPVITELPGGGFRVSWLGGTTFQDYDAAGNAIGAEMTGPPVPRNETAHVDLADGSYLLATPGLIEHHAADGTLLETWTDPNPPPIWSGLTDLRFGDHFTALDGAFASVDLVGTRVYADVNTFHFDGEIAGTDGNVYGGDTDDTISASEAAGELNVFAGAGDDSITVVRDGTLVASLNGEAGDDSIVVYTDDDDEVTVNGGDGGDYIEWAGGGVTHLIGGLGNDTFVVSGSGTLVIEAGAGDDLVQLNSLSTAPLIDLGSGHDVVEMQEGSFTADYGAITFKGFDAGVGGDQLDMYSLLSSILIGWDGSSNPYAGGYLRLVQEGANTRIQVDFDGGANAFTDLAVFVEDAEALVEENLGFVPGAVLIVGSVIYGTNADDAYIAGTNMDDIIYGLDGKDYLNGADGDDFLLGQAGNDRLLGGRGDDLLQGGDGDDTLYATAEQFAGSDADLLDGGEGFDWVEYSRGVSINLLTGETAGGAAGDRYRNIEGFRLSTGADFFQGSNAAEVIDGNGGSDVLRGGGGNDYYYIEGAGATVIENAGEGTDTVESLVDFTLSANIDNLKLKGAALVGTGNDGANSILGTDGNNTLDGKGGADTLQGGLGNDIYYVDNSADKVIEADGAGTDKIFASASYSMAGQFVEDLTLTGSGNINGTGNGLNNIIIGNDGTNTLNGGGGNDKLDGMAGADKLVGGAGNDTYSVDNAGDQVVELVGEGYDAVLSLVSYSLASWANVEALTLVGVGDLNATGNAISNNLIGNSGNNVLDGGGANDVMQGGLGNDIYYVDNSADQVIEANGQGGDTVIASASFNLAGQYVEALVLAGAAAINGTGNSLNNTITGNSGVNTLNGGAGNDRLDGGAGADKLIGGIGNDVFVVDDAGDVVNELSGEGTDTVESSVSFAFGGQYLEVLRLTGAGNINGTGNSQANTLYGNSGNNTLNGGAGADMLYGGLGDDRYVVDDAGDKVFEASGEGTDMVDSSVSFNLIGQYIEVLNLTGSAAINGTGNGQANTIFGNSGVNKLIGGGGDDALHGGLGSDVLNGGAGADHFWFETALGASNVDKIEDFNVADDTIDLDRSIFSGIVADGTLAAGAFRLGAAAVDADDRILYDKATGKIYYDADGVGGAAAVLFAQVTANTALTNADFFGHP